MEQFPFDTTSQEEGTGGNLRKFVESESSLFLLKGTHGSGKSRHLQELSREAQSHEAEVIRSWTCSTPSFPHAPVHAILDWVTESSTPDQSSGNEQNSSFSPFSFLENDEQDVFQNEQGGLQPEVKRKGERFDYFLSRLEEQFVEKLNKTRGGEQQDEIETLTQNIPRRFVEEEQKNNASSTGQLNENVILFLLDDLHDTSPAGLSILKRLVRRISYRSVGKHVLFVAGWNPETGTDFEETFDQMNRWGMVEMKPISLLDREEAKTLLEKQFGDTGTNIWESLPPEAPVNKPLYLRHLLLYLKENDVLQKEGEEFQYESGQDRVPIPTSLKELLISRHRSLSPEEQNVFDEYVALASAGHCSISESDLHGDSEVIEQLIQNEFLQRDSESNLLSCSSNSLLNLIRPDFGEERARLHAERNAMESDRSPEDLTGLQSFSRFLRTTKTNRDKADKKLGKHAAEWLEDRFGFQMTKYVYEELLEMHPGEEEKGEYLEKLGDQFYLLNEQKNAKETYHRVLNCQTKPEVQLRAIRNIARLETDAGFQSPAKEILDQGYEFANELLDREEDPSSDLLRLILLTMCTCARFSVRSARDADRGKELVNRIEEAIAQVSSREHHTKLYSIIAQEIKAEILLLQGNTESAIHQLDEAGNSYQNHNFPLAEARVHKTIGMIHERTNNRGEAITRFQKALSCYRAANSVQKSTQLRNRIGNLYFAEDQLDQALAVDQRHLMLSVDRGDARGIVSGAYNLGLNQELIGNLKQSRAFYRLFLQESEALDDTSRCCKGQIRLAVIDRELGNLDEASDRFSSARELAEEIGNQQEYVESTLELIDTRERSLFQSFARNPEEPFDETEEEQIKETQELLQSIQDSSSEIENPEFRTRIYLLDHNLLRITGNLNRAISGRLAFLEDIPEDVSNALVIEFYQEFILDILLGTKTGNVPQNIENPYSRTQSLLAQTEELLADHTPRRIQDKQKILNTLQKFAFAEDPEEAGRSLKNQITELREQHFAFLADELEAWHRLIDSEVTPVSEHRKDEQEEPDLTPAETDVSDVSSDDLEEVFEILQQFSGTLRPEKPFEQILDTAIDLSDAKRGFLTLLKNQDQIVTTPDEVTVDWIEEHLEIETARDKEGQTIEDPEEHISRHVIYDALQTRSPSLHSDIKSDTMLGDAKSIQQMSLTSIASAPLLVNNQPVGAVYLDNPGEKEAFDEKSRKALSVLSTHAAIDLAMSPHMEDEEAEPEASQLASSMYLHTRLTGELEEVREEGGVVSVLFLDIDNMRELEDALNAEQRSQFMDRIGSRILDFVGPEAVVGRKEEQDTEFLSGNAFEILLPDVSKTDAQEFAQNLCKKLKNSTFEINGEQKEAVVSIGVAGAPGDGTDYLSVVGAADRALLEARGLEGYSVHVSPQTDTATALEGALGGLAGDDLETADHTEEEYGYVITKTLSKVIQTGLDLEHSLEITLDTIGVLTGAKRGFVLLNEGDVRLVPDAYFKRDTADESEVKTQEEVPEEVLNQLSTSVVRRVLRNQEGILTEDAEGDVNLREHGTVQQLELKSLLVVPIVHEDESVGVIYLDDPGSRGTFDEEELNIASSVADLLSGHIASALSHRRQQGELSELREKYELVQKTLESRYSFENLVGQSDKMQEVYDVLERIAPTSVSVIIEGETGTGKELAAHAIHYNSPRSDQPFLAVNCARFSESLLESELFGHEKGAFTGAEESKEGLFEQADGGTLFLDEIGDMSPEMQARLLRVLETGEIRRVGGNETRHVDVRIICATNKNLKSLIDEGQFREDLYYRLQDAFVQMPPLRDRKEDIPLLVDHFLDEFTSDPDEPEKDITDEAVQTLLAQEWAGNVRELKSAVRQLVVYTGDRLKITESDVRKTLSSGEQTAARATNGAPSASAGEAPAHAAGDPRDHFPSLVEREQRAIKEALEITDGNKSEAAELLGVSRATLYNKIDEYDLSE